MINVLIADDQKLFIDGIRSILDNETNIRILGEAADGVQLLELLRANPHTNLVLLDLEMPNMNGVEVTKIMRKEYPRIKILILTYHNESDYIYNLRRMGAHGYVLKNKSGMELVGSIKDVMQNNNRPFPGLIEWGDPAEPWVEEDIQLTSRELDVLRLVHMTREEIADQLGIKTTTVDTHLENLRRKFQVTTTTQLLWKAVKLKFISP